MAFQRILIGVDGSRGGESATTIGGENPASRTWASTSSMTCARTSSSRITPRPRLTSRRRRRVPRSWC